MPDMSNIMGTLFNFLKYPYVLEIIVFVQIFFSFWTGFSRRTYFSIFHTIVIAIMIVVCYFAVEPIVTNYLNTSSFLFAGNGQTFTANMVNLYNTYSSAFPSGYSEALVTSMSNETLKAISWLVLLLCVQDMAFIVSGILWFPLHFFIPKKARKHNKRLPGAILNTIVSAALFFLMFACGGIFGPVFTFIASDSSYITTTGIPNYMVYLCDILNPVYRPLLSWTAEFSSLYTIQDYNGVYRTVYDAMNNFLKTAFEAKSAVETTV